MNKNHNKNHTAPLLLGGGGSWPFLPLLMGWLGWVFLFTSCGNKAGSLPDVTEKDSLYIDTVATLDEKTAPAALVQDSLALDSL